MPSCRCQKSWKTHFTLIPFQIVFQLWCFLPSQRTGVSSCNVVVISTFRPWIIYFLVPGMFSDVLNRLSISRQNGQGVLIWCLRLMWSLRCIMSLTKCCTRYFWMPMCPQPSTEMHLGSFFFYLFLHLFKFHPPVIQHSVANLLGVCARNSFMYHGDTNLVLALVYFASNVAIGREIIQLDVATGLAVIHYKQRWSGRSYNFLNDF